MKDKPPICYECEKPFEPMNKVAYQFIYGRVEIDPYIRYWYCSDCSIELEETEYSC